MACGSGPAIHGRALGSGAACRASRCARPVLAPGIGRYFVQGALNRDYTLVLGVALVAGLLIVLVNLVVDGLRLWLDPRLRAG